MFRNERKQCAETPCQGRAAVIEWSHGVGEAGLGSAR